MKYNRGFYKIRESDLVDRLGRFKQDAKYGQEGFALECVVANLFSSKGYWILVGYKTSDGDGRYGGSQSADMGIDLLVERGGQKTVVQCKHYDGTHVRGPEVCQLLGSCLVAGAMRGIFVTTSGFTKQCGDIRRLALDRGHELFLWDWEVLGRELRENLLNEADCDVPGDS